MITIDRAEFIDNFKTGKYVFKPRDRHGLSIHPLLVPDAPNDTWFCVVITIIEGEYVSQGILPVPIPPGKKFCYFKADDHEFRGNTIIFKGILSYSAGSMEYELPERISLVVGGSLEQWKACMELGFSMVKDAIRKGSREVYFTYKDVYNIDGPYGNELLEHNILDKISDKLKPYGVSIRAFGCNSGSSVTICIDDPEAARSLLD